MNPTLKRMVMLGMFMLSILLGILAVTGMSWLTIDEEGVKANYGLNEGELTMDFYGIKTTFELDWRDSCGDGKDMDLGFDTCEEAAAGITGAIGLWVGIILAAIASVMLILSLAGISAMEGMPDIVQKIISWGAGGMMLFGIIGWMVMVPKLDSEMGYGMSFFMAIFAGLLALGTQFVDMLVPTDE